VALIDLQRSVVELCCDRDPRADIAAELGDARIWGLYREMVRNRLYKELKTALKGAHAAAGEAVFATAFDAHLAQSPPRTRFFYGLVGEFARTAGPIFRADQAVPSFAADLLAYEAAVWEVGDLDDRLGFAVVELDFESEVVLAPAHRLLHVGHAVHDAPQGEDTYEVRDTYLCVYRPAEEKKARTWSLNAVTYELMCRWSAGGHSVTSAVRDVATARGIAVDETFIEGLCTVLSDFLERGIVLGCKARAQA
jgi:hypothetical protein